jgi:5-methylcytosine-specific restriction protein A
MSTKRYLPVVGEQERQRGPTGRWLCRCGCGEEPLPPRRSFVSSECVERYRVKADPQYARRMVAERDQGVCAKCGMDCRQLWKELVAASPRRKAGIGKSRPETMGDPIRFKLLLLRAGLTKSGFQFRNSCWDMDHIVEVVNGGGSCDLDNLQTLCCRCHREKTNDLLRSRKRTAS